LSMVRCMGITSNIKTALGMGPRLDVLASPFSEGQLQQIVWSDLFGTNSAPISRTDALSIPALSKARDLICATIAKLPLKVLNSSGPLEDADQPAWAYRTDGELSPYLRMLWTLDDLFFYGQSLWYVVRGSEKQILTADRVPYERWHVTPEGVIEINNVPVQAEEVIYFPGARLGILDKDAATLRSAKAVADTLETRIKAPVPVMEIHATGLEEITDDEAKDLVKAYNTARRDPEGATVYTPSSINLISHGDKADSGFMTEGRNGVRLDVANLAGVPVALLDGSTSTASLTYSTQEGRRNEFLDYSLDIWMEAVAGRLSADDVVNRGLHVVFDQTEYLTTLPSPTGPNEQD
jgi:phage portal protein BeeE